MGLDQYLYKKTWVNNNRKNNTHQVVDKTVEIFDKEYPLKDLEYLVYEVGYWRKANQIHKWFVNNVQEGNDDCKEYYVSDEQIKELYDLCVEIINNPQKAEELLPTHTGFFFGSYEYDEYYMRDLQHTIDILKPLLNCNDAIYYSSSW
jgi:hypothetical protein